MFLWSNLCAVKSRMKKKLMSTWSISDVEDTEVPQDCLLPTFKWVLTKVWSRLRHFKAHFCLPSAYSDLIIKFSQSFRTPNLWIVAKCRTGQEKATVILLMRKYLTYLNSPDVVPLEIRSAFGSEVAKGFIYVEAYRQSHVKEAS